MFLSCGWGIAVFFTFLFQCWPVSKAWNIQLEGSCIEFVPFLWANSVINFVIDWLVLAVPIVPVWHLQMSKVKKALVGGTIALGSLYVPAQSSTHGCHWPSSRACIGSTVRSAETSSFDFNNFSGRSSHVILHAWALSKQKKKKKHRLILRRRSGSSLSQPLVLSQLACPFSGVSWAGWYLKPLNTYRRLVPRWGPYGPSPHEAPTQIPICRELASTTRSLFQRIIDMTQKRTSFHSTLCR